MKDIISKSNASKEMKATMNLGKIFFYLVMYLHIVACYWYLIIRMSGPQQYFKYVDEGNIFRSSGNDTFTDQTTGEPYTSPMYEAVFGNL